MANLAKTPCESESLNGIAGGQLFDNMPELLTPEMVAALLHSTRGTVYQWNSRPKRYGIPGGMFIKHGRKLLVRRDVLRAWVLSRSS